jgi:uncharacterized cupredoxin-like copper-binding protein
MNRRLLSLAALAAAAALALAACGGKSTTSATTTEATDTTTTTSETTTMPETSQPATTTEASTTTPSPDAAPVAVTIVVRDGKVVGGLAHATLKQGDNAVLVVRSDVADEVHLHGYDKHVDVTPGKTARLAFIASIPGRFEVELENRAHQIADLEVRP